MKRHTTSVLTVLVIIVGCMGTASAGTVAKADVPFEFSIGDRTYSAGTYSLVALKDDLLALYDERGQNVGMMLTMKERNFEPPTESKMKFELINGRHVLTEVWTAGQPTGYMFAVKGATTAAAAVSSGGGSQDARPGRMQHSN
ncbi:MAG TPA: hypothetical protein VMI10_24420 [Terriglobales bacterium]|nr:hypothetical protein [Terriglobales bacterium]